MADESFKEKIRSLHFGRPDRRGAKVTKDELGHVTTEHWNDRVDVTINAPTIKVKPNTTEERD